MIAAAILAGGRSARMGGGDKALALLAGETILSRIIARLSPQVDRIAINANGDAARFASFGLPVFADRLTVPKGPLGGLHASLLWAGTSGADMLLTVTADAPFIPLDLARRLTAAGPPAMAASAGQAHFAIGLWPIALQPELERVLATGTLLRMQDWASHCGAATAAWSTAPHDPFFNINTPDDLAGAECICKTIAP